MGPQRETPPMLAKLMCPPARPSLCLGIGQQTNLCLPSFCTHTQPSDKRGLSSAHSQSPVSFSSPVGRLSRVSGKEVVATCHLPLTLFNSSWRLRPPMSSQGTEHLGIGKWHWGTKTRACCWQSWALTDQVTVGSSRLLQPQGSDGPRCGPLCEHGPQLMPHEDPTVEQPLY